jgi:eukaryotic-like serine/threonine-protein kinase
MESTIAKAGRYEVLGELGRGAMGVVYRATDPVIGRPVAVKTIRLSEAGTGLSREELLARFQTEARAAGLLTHPNIVVVYDAGEENGLYYITMELVEGKSLQHLIDFGHSFPVPRVLRIMEQTCSALQFAHERNVVHRDIKPANLMLTRDDTLKVTDFGTAKILQFGTVQQTTHVMGTPSYMSPEQVKGRAVDGRSDIFSLGVVFYELLTNEKPFPGQSITTVIYKIVNEEPIPPRQLNPALHPGLNEIVMKALSKDPETRFQSCRQMLEAMKNYRALGGGNAGPDATMASTNLQATQALGAQGTGLRGAHVDDLNMAARARALEQRGTLPTQTPAIRRTGPIQALPEPKKKNTTATVLAAIFLLGVIVYGVNRLRPEFQAARERARAAKETKPAISDVKAPEVPAADAGSPADSSANVAVPTTEPSSKPAVAVTAPVAPVVKKPEGGLSTAAAEYKGRIEEAIAEQGLGSRVQVRGSGNALTLTGKLRPSEHSGLLKFMRNAPATVQVVDHIQYDDEAVPGGNAGDGSHPVPAAGKSAIHVVTDVLGATATLIGPAGRALSHCSTPCSFNDLAPKRYSLQVEKEGYRAVQTALELRAGESQDEKLHLESLALGLRVTSNPAGADIWLNGAKSGQTPATLPLAAGQYNLVLRLQGYDAYSAHVQVEDNAQTTFDAELKQKNQHVAWAQVNSVPEGAEIIIDGTSTGEFSPARVQMPAGSHVVMLKLKGYKVAKTGVEASEGGTVTVSQTMKK